MPAATGPRCRDATLSTARVQVRRPMPRCVRTAAGRTVTAHPPTEAHIQLGTAAVPSKVQIPAFVDGLYQWASTMSQSGANYPTALPLKVDKLSNGFKISLLKRMGQAGSGTFDSAGDIQGTVEEEAGKTILFVRFYEGPASLVDRRTAPPSNVDERLEVILDSLVDVKTIMQTMPGAIMAAAKASSA